MSSVVGTDDGKGYGLIGRSDRGIGVFGYSNSNNGVHGSSGSNRGVYGFSDSNSGVYGSSHRYIGVYGYSYDSVGVYAYSGSGHAAYLAGNVTITGSLSKAGGSFKVDHPLDPANKYLSHSSVNSPDMKNIYDGVVVLDAKGEAQIDLPDWFSALNKDFRYQLTAIGAPGPNIHVAEEISDNATTDDTSSGIDSNNNNNNSHFRIAGGTSGMKVSWQVTGIRRDPWANAYRVQVEEDKLDKERGHYTYPDLYGQPEEKKISHLLFPEEKPESLTNENNPN
jgi:hypothetical protein